MIHTAFSALKVHNGYGRHQSYLTVEQTREAHKWDYITQHFLFLILCITKISICLFALRIKNTKWLRRSLYALMIGLVVTNGGCVIVLLAKCHPIRGNWDGEVGICWNPVIYNDIIWVQVGNKPSLFRNFFDAEICSRLLYILRLDLFASSNRSFVESQNPVSVQNGHTRPDGLGIAVFSFFFSSVVAPLISKQGNSVWCSQGLSFRR